MYLAFQGTDCAGVWQAMSAANWRWVLLALVSVGVNQWTKAWRWSILFSPTGRRPGINFLLASSLVGQMLNAFFPVRMGEISRMIVVGRHGPGQAFVLGTLAVEKLLDMFLYGLLFIFLLLLMPLPGWAGGSGYAFVGITIALAMGAWGLAFWRSWVLVQVERITRRLPVRWQERVIGYLRSGLATLDVLQRGRDLLGLAFSSALTWGAALLTNYLVFLALGLDLPPAAALLVIVAVQAGISLAAIPGRVGIFEYSCSLALTAFGVDPAKALSYGILLHALVYLPVILPGVVLFWVIGASSIRSELSQMAKE